MTHNIVGSLGKYECLPFCIDKSSLDATFLEDLTEDLRDKAEYYCRKIVRSRVVSPKRVRDFLEAYCSESENSVLCEEFLSEVTETRDDKMRLFKTLLSFMADEKKWNQIEESVDAALEYAEIDAKSTWVPYDYKGEIDPGKIKFETESFIREWNSKYDFLPIKAFYYEPKNDKQYKLVVVFWLTTGYGKRPIVELEDGNPRLYYESIKYTSTFALRFKDRCVEASKDFNKMGSSSVRKFVSQYFSSVLKCELKESVLKERIAGSARRITMDLEQESNLEDFVTLKTVKERIIENLGKVNIDEDLEDIIRSVVESMRLMKIVVEEEVLDEGRRSKRKVETSDETGLDTSLDSDKWRKMLADIKEMIKTTEESRVVKACIKIAFDRGILDKEAQTEKTWIEINTNGGFTAQKWLKANYPQVYEALRTLFAEYAGLE